MITFDFGPCALCDLESQGYYYFQDKEGLISELRKELRISDVEHREILGKADSDDLIKMIRCAIAISPLIPSMPFPQLMALEFVLYFPFGFA